MLAVATTKTGLPAVADCSGSEPPPPSVIICPNCGKRARWMGHDATRVACPRCREPLVVLVDLAGEWKALLETDEAVEEMVSDWLHPDSEEDEDEDDLDDTARARECHAEQAKP